MTFVTPDPSKSEEKTAKRKEKRERERGRGERREKERKKGSRQKELWLPETSVSSSSSTTFASRMCIAGGSNSSTISRSFSHFEIAGYPVSEQKVKRRLMLTRVERWRSQIDRKLMTIAINDYPRILINRQKTFSPFLVPTIINGKCSLLSRSENKIRLLNGINIWIDNIWSPPIMTLKINTKE